jgi:D-alanine-D-alanine ligase
MQKPLYIWVLSPQLETADPNLDYYYDFKQSIEEYTRAFEVLKLQWKWQPVTTGNYKEIIDGIASASENFFPVVLNLCDGDEVNGTPGISVIHYLEEKKLCYTGADANYYHLTTSKIIMKQAFDKHGVANAAWAGITAADENIAGIFEKVGRPLIAKPAVSGGSMGLGVKNVVSTEEELKAIITEMYKGYRGWDFVFGGIVAEQFIAGPEYTVLIIGSHKQPNKAIIYPPIERIFHEGLPETEKILSYDRLWEMYENEKPIGDNEFLYNYHKPDAALVHAINKLSWDAYCAVGGMGYGRIDVRMDKATGKLYILEVNAQCGLSEDENYTSIGAILRLSNRTYADMTMEIINDALERNTPGP